MFRAKTPKSTSTTAENALHTYQCGSGISEMTSASGAGGELHQNIPACAYHGAGQRHLTDNHGHRLANDQNSLRVGERGPTQLQDFALREKIFHLRRDPRATPAQGQYRTRCRAGVAEPYGLMEVGPIRHWDREPIRAIASRHFGHLARPIHETEAPGFLSGDALSAM